MDFCIGSHGGAYQIFSILSFQCGDFHDLAGYDAMQGVSDLTE